MSKLHNLEAEQALLGALLFDNGLHEFLAVLEPDHFYDPVHGRIFAMARKLIQQGRVADGISLKAAFARDDGIKEIGGAVYLMKLMEAAAPLTQQACAYAGIVIDLSLRRRLEAALRDLGGRLESEDEDALDLIAAGEASLQGLSESGYVESADVADAGEQFILGMDTPSLATGIAGLDEALGGLHAGELIILAGRPSMGKTALAAQLARNAAERGKVVHFASLEMPKEQLACRAMSAFSWRREYGTQKVQYYHLRNGSNVDRRLLGELAAELPRSLVIDDRAAQTLAQLEHSARATRRRLKRLDLIVVDYLQLMRSMRGDNRVQEVSDISAGLKAIAKRLGCPVVALSQLSRQVENREDKRPLLSDLRESGAIEQDADVVMFVYREAYYLERREPDGEAPAGDWAAWQTSLDRCKRDMDAIIAKQRAGPTKTVRLLCHLEFDVVIDPAPRTELRVVQA